jgi:hypothetical protein
MPCRQALKRNDVCLLSPFSVWDRDRGPRVELTCVANGGHLCGSLLQTSSSSCRSTSAQLCVIAVANVIHKLPIDLGSTLRLSSRAFASLGM